MLVFRSGRSDMFIDRTPHELLRRRRRMVRNLLAINMSPFQAEEIDLATLQLCLTRATLSFNRPRLRR